MKELLLIAMLAVSSAVPGPSKAQDRPGQPDLAIDATLRAEVLDAVVRNMKSEYVFPKVADEVEIAVRQRQRNGEYDGISSASEFAATLTRQLQEITHDKHVSVNYSPKPVPVRKEQAEPSQEERQGLRNYGEAINYGFEKVERLPGNIGYLRLNVFFPVEYGGETAVAAMRLVSGTDALIIDLRGNDGGHPGMIVLLASYFFSGDPVQVSGFFRRKTNTIQQFWTMPYVPGGRYTGKPVYILTSRRTFSGGEAFAYDLQNLKRATVIGETTEGAANPRDVYRINEHFWVGIPNVRPVSPVTQTNWEGTGVKPDVAVPAEFALKTAHLAALNKLLNETSADDPNRKENLRKLLTTVQQELEELKKGAAK